MQVFLEKNIIIIEIFKWTTLINNKSLFVLASFLQDTELTYCLSNN